MLDMFIVLEDPTADEYRNPSSGDQPTVGRKNCLRRRLSLTTEA